MDLNFYIRKTAEDSKLMLIGVMSTNVDLSADTKKRFLFTATKTNSDGLNFRIRQTTDVFVDTWGYSDFEAVTADCMLKQKVWAGYPANTDTVGGYLCVYRTQNLPGEDGVYRYIVVAAFDNACDLMNGSKFIAARSSMLSIEHESGVAEIEASIDLEYHPVDVYCGETVSQILTGPNWQANGQYYGLNSDLELHLFNKLSEYTKQLVESPDSADEQLRDYLDEKALLGHSCRDEEYHGYLRFHFGLNSPIFKRAERLLLPLEVDEINRIDSLYSERHA